MGVCIETDVFCDFLAHRLDLATVLQRTKDRAKTVQSSANPELVRVMHKQFDALNSVDSRTINTSDKSPTVVFEEFLSRQLQGDFALLD
jgi:hypothetical protein